MASVRGDLKVKQGTANLAEDYCFIHKALRPVGTARRQIAAVPSSNSRPAGRNLILDEGLSSSRHRSVSADNGLCRICLHKLEKM